MADKKERWIVSGVHLRTMRSWLQRKARNGDTITWGSQEYVDLKSLTAHDLDRLAQDIRDAVVKERKDKESKLLTVANKVLRHIRNTPEKDQTEELFDIEDELQLAIKRAESSD